MDGLEVLAASGRAEAGVPARGQVLVVDDMPEVLAFCEAVLQPDFDVVCAQGGQSALDALADGLSPDLVLLDVVMHQVDGHSVLRTLRGSPQWSRIPVVLMTSLTDDAEETRGLGLGAVDFIRKPINFDVLVARVRNHVELKRSRDLLRRHSEALEAEVARRTLENERIRDITIQTLASLAETRDSETGNHILRTKNYVRLLALALRTLGRDREALSDDAIALMYKSAPLHDIGKVGVPDRILLKPGALDDDERQVMKRHTLLGREAIERAEQQLGIHADFLRVAKDIAGGHHERWDGTGYPQGLRGEQIPLAARLMAVADVYDALISRRCYKAPMPHAEVVQLLAAGRGTQFDPLVTDAFLAVQHEFDEVARRYADAH